MNNEIQEKIKQTALVVVRDVCALKKGERVLIITNPENDTLEISRRLYEAADELGGKAVIVMQKTKTLKLLRLFTPSRIFAFPCLQTSSEKMRPDRKSPLLPKTAKSSAIFSITIMKAKKTCAPCGRPA